MANVKQLAEAALTEGAGILRLAPNWVPRSFLQPGKRIKLHPADYYALGTHRGGIDERWFASTTPATNEGAPPDEGLSYVVMGKERFTLRDAVADLGAELVGESIWNAYSRWPVYSKFFDNMGPIPHHMHQSDAQAKLVKQEGKPESYYFPPQLNAIGNNFPYTFMGLEPGTTKQDVIRCLERWNDGDNGILDLSKAYRLKPGTGWLVPPCVLHAPGSLVTYEPQWGSDVFGMYQSMVEGRAVPRSLLTKDFPKEKHDDVALPGRRARLGRQRESELQGFALPRTDPRRGDGEGRLCRPLDRLRQIRRQATLHRQGVDGRAGCQVHDQRRRGLRLDHRSGERPHRQAATRRRPAMIRFGQMTEDEVFVSAKAAAAGVVVENTGTGPLVGLRYFGPDAQPSAPNVGDHKKR